MPTLIVQRWRAACLVLALTQVCSSAMAMGLFSSTPALRQTELSPAELSKLQIQSGWSNDDPQLMLFEVGNKLSGPIFCVGASFEFKDGKNATKPLNPNSTYLPTTAAV